MRLITLVLPFALAACTQFPQLDGAVSSQGQNADFPTLIPIETLLAQTASSGLSPQETTANLSARVAALQNRAARLRGAVVDANTRIRMQNGIK